MVGCKAQGTSLPQIMKDLDSIVKKRENDQFNQDNDIIRFAFGKCAIKKANSGSREENELEARKTRDRKTG